jgi:hypothetical protein
MRDSNIFRFVRAWNVRRGGALRRSSLVAQRFRVVDAIVCDIIS